MPVVGRSNVASGGWATVDGGYDNRATDQWGVVGGGYDNKAGKDDGNTLNQGAATVGGGVSNTAGGSGATVFMPCSRMSASC